MWHPPNLVGGGLHSRQYPKLKLERAMKLKKMMTLTGAALGAGALALAPTAANAAITTLTVTSTDASGSLVPSANVTMPVYGSATSLSCGAGSVTGTWSGLGAVFTGLSLSSCTSFIPGTTVTMSLNSNLTWTPDVTSTVAVGKTDVVNGTISGASNAVKVTTSTGCTITLGGSTTGTFTESSGTLSLTGSGLKVASAGILCAGAVSAGDALTMKSVNFALNGGADYS